MNNSTSFSILSKVQDLYVKPENINGSFDGLRSFLNVYVDITNRLPTGATEMGVYSATARLKLLQHNILLSEAHADIGNYFLYRQEQDTGAWFNFILDEKAIHAIEKYRNGDIMFGIDLSFLISVRHQDLYPNGGIMKGTPHTLQFNISRSDWVEKILPKLGLHTFKLIEVPLSHRKLHEAYDYIIAEFQQAEKYFNIPDYNKCVAHCRHTLDALTRNLRKIKETGDSETKFQWLKKIDAATIAWIDELNKAHTALTSKTHHSGLKTEFTRQETESIYLVTLGLLNYVGHLSQQ